MDIKDNDSTQKTSFIPSVQNGWWDSDFRGDVILFSAHMMSFEATKTPQKNRILCQPMMGPGASS